MKGLKEMTVIQKIVNLVGSEVSVIDTQAGCLSYGTLENSPDPEMMLIRMVVEPKKIYAAFSLSDIQAVDGNEIRANGVFR
jgi:ferredoxin-fold anticodon binding domain-containing protein